MSPQPEKDYNVVDIVENLKAGAQQMADHVNKGRETDYHLKCANARINCEAGRVVPKDVWPKVPLKVIPGPPDEFGFVLGVVDSTEPVCAEEPMPEDRLTPPTIIPNNIHVGKRIFGDWFVVGPGDSIPAGQTVPGIAEGETTPAMFTKFGAAVGAGWYLKVG